MKKHKQLRDYSITNLLPSREIKSTETIAEDRFFDMIHNKAA